MNIEHQYDCKGGHRIVIDGQPSTETLYEHAAFAEKDGKWFMAVTPYYEGTLPHEMTQGVFELTRVGEDAKDAAAYDFYCPEAPCPWLAQGKPCNVTTVCPQKKGGE